jgi:hypothetical protein
MRHPREQLLERESSAGAAVASLSLSPPSFSFVIWRKYPAFLQLTPAA